MRISRSLLLLLIVTSLLSGQTSESVRNVLVVTAGAADPTNPAHGDGRQLAALLGHFDVKWELKGVGEYRSGDVNAYDLLFYVGFDVHNAVPAAFANDVLHSTKPVVWLNTGMIELCRLPGVTQRIGFTVQEIDSVSGVDRVRVGSTVFKKDDPHLGRIKVLNPHAVEILATAYSQSTRREHPYAIRSGRFTYFADSPFAYAIPGGHYLYFADYLHDLLHQPHEQTHQAMVRIEDVTLFEDPDKLREIADFLSSRDVPFMVGVIPFFVDPAEGTRLALTDKPELVDALQYMVRNGGTIVMHGVTHQYKGLTATDFEFWDEGARAPIKGETEEAIARKLEMGIQEFMKNGLYPLVWETPHYTASFALYRTAAKYFSTACEQRLAIENDEWTQFFPYVINRDIFGQTIYPENLGYVPQGPDKKISEDAVKEILANAAAQHYVRDGIATFFFHAFLDLDLLEALVTGMHDLGYTFMDMREQKHWVRTSDRAILSGSQTVTVRMNNQYLFEAAFDRNGDVKERRYSDQRVRGDVARTVTLAPGEFYKLEPVEFRELEPTFLEELAGKAERVYESVVSSEEDWLAPRVRLLWNHYALGAAYNDQASFGSVFHSVGIPVDTVFLGEPLTTDGANIIVVPYASADSLSPEQITSLGHFVASGGNLIMDGRTAFAPWFGVRFTESRVQVRLVRDRLFPEERISWPEVELVSRFDASSVDKVFCVDEATDVPLAAGLRYGKGRVLFINARFDPRSQLGTSHFPFLLEYCRKYFLVRPVIRSEHLEMYFDPGFRHTQSIEHLVRSWVNNGYRVIHVSGWHEYPKYTYDYERLIRLAHSNGILVYAWLEPPQVSQKFWTDHPAWREKNYRGEDVRPSWRYPMAMTDPACVAAMTEKYREILLAYDWDGVNLAEVYFEAGRGFDDPHLFTPAHPTALAEIKRLLKTDLASVFDSSSSYWWKRNAAVRERITEYRVRHITRLHETFLTALQKIASMKPGFDIVVTAMDELGSPELREQIGVDMNELVALQHKFGFVLQVEDPQSRWSASPLRYEEIGDRYRAKLTSPDRMMLDLNILTFRNPETSVEFPTLLQTGTESFQLVHSASHGAPRVGIYSESSVNPQDAGFLSSGLAANVEAWWNGDTVAVSSPASFIMRLPNTVKEIEVDDVPVMPSRDNRYFIPAGRHRVVMRKAIDNALSPHELQPRLLSSTGNVTSLSYGTREIRLTYESSGRMLVAISNSPASVEVDGREIQVVTFKGNDCYSVFLPSGRHTAVIVVGGAFEYGVTMTSFWSTTMIALFGLGSVLTLTGMYIVLRILRRRPAYSH